MLRWLYIQLIWLHPAPFRWRFGDDMLDDFDRAPLRGRPQYFADAVASLARQWLLRPEFRRLDGQTAALAAAGAPLFRTLDDYKPRPAALLHGGLLAILSILAAVALIGTGGGALPYLIGAHFSRQGLLHLDRQAAAARELNTSVSPEPDPSEALLKIARRYFLSMPVLRALDADPDFSLSPWEIGNAPVALRKLDTNYNGKLTPDECGLYLDPDSASPALLAQRRRRFMTFHPVLAALDANHDGEISAWEIEHAAASLKTLDFNDDGYLTAGELLPFELAVRAGLRPAPQH